ncbi:MAG: hypothetical protein EBS37_14990 [Betaproteobacteria bacterium]|nr:hypothetical protein [Betaproteobacteria bacterium]
MIWGGASSIRCSQ